MSDCWLKNHKKVKSQCKWVKKKNDLIQNKNEWYCDSGHFRLDSFLYRIVNYVWYGVATISRMLKNICLFAEYRSLL